jgi:hypothetical protein
MATYAVQTPVHAGTQYTWVTPVSGDLAPTGPANYLRVFNGSVSSITVTLPVPNVDGTLTVASRVVTVPASTLAAPNPVDIPLPPSVYGTGTVAITYSATTTISVCVMGASVS